MTPTPNDSISVRLRLTPEQAATMQVVQRFLGLPSLSQTAARLAVWNAQTLAAALGDEKAEQTAADAAADAARSVFLTMLKGAKG